MPTATIIATLGLTQADAPLAIDLAGDLFSTTPQDGTNGDGSIIEITDTAGSYAAARTTLVSFDGADGTDPGSSLVADANGDLFGVSLAGGADGLGTVYEIPASSSGYPATPTTLTTFAPTPTTGSASIVTVAHGEVFIDQSGNVFVPTDTAVTNGGGDNNNDAGPLLEFSSDSGTYVQEPPVTAEFPVYLGNPPYAPIPYAFTSDSAGDLFISFGGSGAPNDVYDFVKTSSGYTPTGPVYGGAFYSASSANPIVVRAVDSNGNLFGTAATGVSGNAPYVFEFDKTGAGYSTTPIVLADFATGDAPQSLMIDAAGNLFGTTNSDVFEIANTGSGYASTPTILANLAGEDVSPSLVVDAAGDLFGITETGGTNGGGTIFEVTNSGYQVACYLRGTRIATPAGEVPIEALSIGDHVLTADGGALPIRWIGRRCYDGRFLRGRSDIQPVRICAGALGGGLPRRDLLVSPEHAMLLHGYLVPAMQLVNGTTVLRERGLPVVDYFHVELAQHDAILAEGAASESFVDDDSRMLFQNAADYAARYPDAATTPVRFCAPRIVDGYALQAIRDHLTTVRFAA